MPSSQGPPGRSARLDVTPEAAFFQKSDRQERTRQIAVARGFVCAGQAVGSIIPTLSIEDVAKLGGDMLEDARLAPKPAVLSAIPQSINLAMDSIEIGNLKASRQTRDSPGQLRHRRSRDFLEIKCAAAHFASYSQEGGRVASIM